MRRMTIVAFLALLAVALPVTADELLPLENAWAQQHVELAKGFGDGVSNFEFTLGEARVELVQTVPLKTEWVVNKSTGLWQFKRNWTGDVYIEGARVGTNNAFATSVDDVTWATVFGREGITLLFPDGRVRYSTYEEIKCGTDTSGILEALEFDFEKKASRVPKSAVTTKLVLYTSQAEIYWGGPAATQAFLLHLQDLQNKALADSGRPQYSVKFVGFLKDSTWDESWTDGSKYASVLTQRFAGNKYYQRLKKKWKAQKVVMFATAMPGSYNGIAQFNGTYMLVSAQTAAQGTDMHETGHTLGLSHLDAYVYCAANPEVTTADGFSTVMFAFQDPPTGLSVPVCNGYGFERLFRYSNPQAPYVSPVDGQTRMTGDAAHNEVVRLDKNIHKHATVKY